MDTKYQAYLPDKDGYINYTIEDNETWGILYNRQVPLIQNRACSEYIEGLNLLNIGATKVPQPIELSERLRNLTGWAVEPVPALISFKLFFELLSERKFPAASFIRTREELDYLKEPDIFHEVFGHCPLLTNPSFAKLTEKIGQLGLELSKENRVLLARLYWFTVEFGLMNTIDGLKIYGAGILSSKTESIYSLEDPKPIRKEFDIIDILRTPYRYDELQKTYYIIDSFEDIYNMISSNTLEIFETARQLGMKSEDTINHTIMGC